MLRAKRGVFLFVTAPNKNLYPKESGLVIRRPAAQSIFPIFCNLRRNFSPARRPNLSLPLGEMSHSDREGLYQLCALSDLPDAEFVTCSPSQSFASQMPALPEGEPRSWCAFISSLLPSKTGSETAALPANGSDRSSRQSHSCRLQQSGYS